MKIINALLLISFLPLLTTARLTSSDVSATELEQKLHKRGIKPTRQGTRRVKSKGSKGDKSSKGGKSEKSEKSEKSQKMDPVQPPKPPQPTVPKTWQEKCEIIELTTSVHSVSLSDDGNTMAIGYFGFVKVYQIDPELNTCTEMEQSFGGGNGLSSVSLSADGLTLAVALPKVSVYRLDGGTWSKVSPDDNQDQEGTNVIVSRNGSKVAIADFTANNFEGKVSVYKINDWVKLGDDFVGENQGDNFGVSISFGKNGKRIAIGTLSSTVKSYVRIYDWKEGAWEPISSPNVGEEGSQLAPSLSENGKTLAIGTSKDGAGLAVDVYKYRIVNGNKEWVSTGQQIQSTYGDLFGQSIALSNNGKKLAVAGEGFAQIFQFKKKFKRWNAISDIIEGAEDSNYLDVIAISGDGKTVAFGGDSTKVLKYE